MKKFFSKLTFATALSVAFASCQKANIADLAPDNQGDDKKGIVRTSGVQVVPNELLVKFKAGLSEDEKMEVLTMVQGKVKEVVLTEAMKSAGDKEGIALLHTSLASLEAVARLQRVANVEYAEPNFIYNHFATSNDTYFTNGSLWGMYAATGSPANQFGCGARTAWANGKTGSSSVYIGVIDEGVMHTHPDLAANFGTNPGEIAGNGIDDDGNGYKDDVRGWDFAANDATVFDGVSDDHGTHCAGTIGAVGGNAAGVAGVVWNVKMLSGKFLGSTGGTTANAIKAIDYFTDLKTRAGLKIVATSNSWGGGGFSQALQDAIVRANNNNILFIAAAGNGGSDGIGDNNNTVANYPSNYPVANVIAVASITSTGALSSFSNFGSTQVDLGAPGSGIWSTIPRRSGSTVVGGYASYNGTSMATPHVSGAAALYASVNPTASMTTIKNAILSSVTPTASLSGKTVTGGRLNVAGF
jgi:subtilisin family serine protease